jgi:hypothetical protein
MSWGRTSAQDVSVAEGRGRMMCGPSIYSIYSSTSSSSIWAPAQQPYMRLLTSARIKACSAAPKGPNIPNSALQAHACVALLA